MVDVSSSLLKLTIEEITNAKARATASCVCVCRLIIVINFLFVWQLAVVTSIVFWFLKNSLYYLIHIILQICLSIKVSVEYSTTCTSLEEDEVHKILKIGTFITLQDGTGCVVKTRYCRRPIILYWCCQRTTLWYDNIGTKFLVKLEKCTCMGHYDNTWQNVSIMLYNVRNTHMATERNRSHFILESGK